MSLPPEHPGVAGDGAFPGPGAHVGPYRIVRQLGHGGMGIVFEAVDGALDRRVALKIISPHLANDPAFRARFTREAQAQASLDSPYVVTVFAHGSIDDRLYIATQLIPDGDLGAMLRAQGAPPPDIALDIIAQVATGLADAHAMGLVHRDIKPANVLLRLRERSVSAYLGDFGIARRVDNASGLTTDGSAIGTPTYMAPELHTGGRPGPATDVYSLGCLLWAALCGRAPYVGTTDYQIVAAHVSEPIPQLVEHSAFDHEVNRILRASLAKHASDRYPTADLLRDDLRRVLASLPAPARVSPVPAAAPSPAAHPPHHQVAQHHEPPVQHHQPQHQPQHQPGYPAGPQQPVHYAASYPPAAPPRRRRTGLVVTVAAAVTALVVGGVGAVVLLTRGGDDPPPDPDPSTSGPTDASSDTSTPDPDGLSEDERTAAENIAEGLVADGEVDEASAACVGRELVKKRGLQDLIDGGFIGEDLEVTNATTSEVDPGLWLDVLTISADCVLEASETPS